MPTLSTPTITPGSPDHGKAKRRPLYRQIADDLQRRIKRGDLRPGRPAPSESELIAEFNVSSTTARRCLNELAQSGLVYRVQGKGTFVSEPPEIAATRQVGIFYHDLIDLTGGFIANALRGVNDVLNTSDVQPALLTLGGVAQSNNPAAALRSLVQRHELDGLLILSPIPPKWLGPTLDLGLPVVAVNFAYADPRIACILVDHAAGAHRLARRVADAGHRRGVAFRGHFDERLVEGVAMTKLELPDDGPINWTVEHYPYFTPGRVQQLAADHLGGDRPPTVFFCFGYESALEVAAAAHARGLSIPEDVSIVFIGSPPNASRYSGEVPPVSDMSAKAAAYLTAAIADEKPTTRNTMLEMTPQPGTTLGPPRKRPTPVPGITPGNAPVNTPRDASATP